mgnify:CR=1 FL=1
MEPTNTAPVAFWFGERVYWIFLGLMFLNLLQRRHQARVRKKRMATLLLGIALFALLVAAQSIHYFGGSDWMFYLAVAGFAAVVYAYRDKMLPFRLRSPVDGRLHTFHEIVFDDEHGDGGAGEDDAEDDASPADVESEERDDER